MLGHRPRTATALALLAGAGIVLAAAAPAQAERPAVPAPLSAAHLTTSTLSPTAATTERISGADRYATSVAASLATFPGPDTPDVVYLVSGENFPDAIVAGPVAAAAGGGLLLTAASSLPRVVADELRRLDPDRIVVVGGTSAISSSVATAAAAIAPVERIGGADRYATAELLVRSVFSSADTVFLATGASFPDALAAGPAAGTDGEPVLIVRGNGSRLDRAALSLLRDLGTTSVVLVGGTSVVSPGIESQLRSELGSSQVQRAAGADRYATARAISESAFGTSAPRVLVASGTSFADALSISVLAAREDLPLYLSLPYCTPSSVRSALGSSAITTRTLVGGPGALSPGVERLEECRSVSSASSLWVLVNKRNGIPTSYVPSSLRRPSLPSSGSYVLRSDAATALERMYAGVRAAGAGSVGLTSGYRPASSQAAIYNNAVRTRGQTYADLYVARPGHSEHQTGLAADLYPIGASNCSSYTCLGATSQGRWLAANSWKYGYILRYEQGTTAVTGYEYESWHFRYVGETLAADYAASGRRTLEQFYGQPAAPRY
ncbi:MAG: cell wall-binding repeat-containing protein [Actinobacteria bacterium]|nr:cell wall-binding repeat-containing protein [Actinomycetota bacterium]MBU1607979.1 cell wall-binding repeat-containing protein [Actinomycetota bacterium]MBU2316155.1 cell wall-binding repeat-containing protein [Actinomycetota bacterium]MBU2386173.1 cell wall-binding repeat-containing protein [Actinomycetota bacterium]